MKKYLKTASIILLFLFLLSFNDSAAEITFVIGEPAGTIHPLLGVNTGPLIETREQKVFDSTEWYRKIGVTAVRTHDFYGYLDMSAIYPDQNADPYKPSSYNFESSDRFFLAILKGGFEPYLRIGDSWSSGPQFPSLKRRSPVNKTNWIRAAVEVVRHYRKLAGPKLRYVEIWNEPDHRKFWDASLNEFCILFDETARALKTEFPDLKIGGPGFTAAAVLLPKGKFVVESFLDYLQKHHTPVDFISWHLYSNNPDMFASAARFYRNQLDAHGFKTAESHLTEYNTDGRQIPQEMTLSGLRMGCAGASILTAAWIALQNENVEMAFFYRGTDVAMDQPLFFGMFRANGAPKPSALAFSFWSRIASCTSRLKVMKTETHISPLRVIGGRNNSGDILLLISNPSAEKIPWMISFSENQPVSGMTVEEISDSYESVVKRNVAGNKDCSPAYSVQLITIKNKN
ncbi:MAG TPA: glycosyl hydrolase [bacterium]|nr:glycosyl hydrolase [bacterium]HPO52291.1 glycosyl hydrolase [bacterium]